MTVVSAVMARVYTFGMFDDLTDVPHVRTFDSLSKVTTLTFDGELSAEVKVAIRDRVESKNDVDQARRADLRAKRDAVVGGATLENVAALAVAEANYMLGD